MTVFPARGICRARVLYAAATVLGLLLAGCHSSRLPPPGTPVVTLGDVSGDVMSYVVNIDGVTLTANDGGIASIFPAAVEVVDLAKLTDGVEFLGAPAAASGTYVSATVTLDFSAAIIWYNNNGTPVSCTPK